jgi:glycosyltransferase involved in cell wall biosynthesis
MKVFYLFSDVERRSEVANSQDTESGERYILWGMDDLQKMGLTITSNLDQKLAPRRSLAFLEHAFNRLLRFFHISGGDFAAVFKSISAMNKSEVIFSTVDRVGIPLIFFSWMGFIKSKIVYVSIGLPERLERLPTPWLNSLFRRALQKVDTIICYGWGEAEYLRKWMGAGGNKVCFIPMGVDVNIFAPVPGAAADIDVVSIGRDSNRDYPLLIQFAADHPQLKVLVVAKKGQIPRTNPFHKNLQVREDIPFAEIKATLSRAKVVALPLYQNSYSGATTTLLQAMAMAKAVVVTRTSAISEGYFLKHGENVVWVEPGDQNQFSQAILDLLQDKQRTDELGQAARETALRHLCWRKYVQSLYCAFKKID